jgi:hypothetical protein
MQRQHRMKNKYLSLRQAAEESGRSYWSLRDAALRGELKTTRFGARGKFYIKPADLEAYFNRNANASLSEVG